MDSTTGPRTDEVIDLFAGPGGWSQGLRQHLGIRDIGLEWDRAACLTRHAAGHLTIQTDVAAYPTRHMAHLIKGLIASPPCTLFSSAGKGTGRRVLDLLADGIRRLFRGDDCRDAIRDAVYPVALAERQAANARKAPEKQLKPERVEAIAREDAFCAVLVLEPARWIAELLAAGGILEWACLEQVPAVLPLWEVYVEELRKLGWSAWAGKPVAADYGVPQTRERAILIASKVRAVQAPAPTHRNPKKDDALAELGIESLFAPELPRWVSMADALGLVADQIVNTRGNRRTPGGNEFSADGPSWALTEKTRSWVLRSRRDSEKFKAEHGERENRGVDEPAPTFTGEAHRWAWGLRNNTNANASVRTLDEPAGTLFFGHRLNNVSWVSTEPGVEAEAVRITAQEAAVIQSFPPDYPWRGSRTKQFEQIGNAVPPLLAAHVVSAATGIPLHTALPAALASA